MSANVGRGTVVNGVDYGKCTLCKMIHCCPCQPMKYEIVNEAIPDQMTFIVKPDSFCFGVPCYVGMRSIDIHRISKNGNVSIEKCAIFHDARVTLSDVIRMGYSGSIGSQILQYDAVNCFPEIRSTPIEQLPNDLLYDTKESIKQAVNDFLQDKRVSMGRKSLLLEIVYMCWCNVANETYFVGRISSHPKMWTRKTKIKMTRTDQWCSRCLPTARTVNLTLTVTCRWCIRVLPHR
eukprot:gb/GECG01013364.1/.p1 GENE.gb/GECG01013364.1/~~gb/GECG01013364.1/.p1  ORF type:complete len:235 (+),score=12.48 gb/GECG01013364.1/:1-705(+)